MAERKTYVERLLDDYRQGQLTAEDVVSKVNSHIESRERALTKELVEQKRMYESQFREVFGVDYDNYIKGYNFEQSVVRWMFFTHNQYSLKIWQGDKCVKVLKDAKTLSATWNKYPDLIYVDDKNKKVVALECKYRENGILQLDEDKYRDYLNFKEQIGEQMKVDVQVYLLVGSGPFVLSDPEYMYCIPIEYLQGKETVNMRDIPQYKIQYLGEDIKKNYLF